MRAGEAVYRVSVKRELHSAAGEIHRRYAQGRRHRRGERCTRDLYTSPGKYPRRSAERRNRRDASACHASSLVAEASERDVWWLYGTRNGREHPSPKRCAAAAPTELAHARAIGTARPIEDRPGVDFDATGHLGLQALKDWNCPAMRISTSADHRAS